MLGELPGADGGSTGALPDGAGLIPRTFAHLFERMAALEGATGKRPGREVDFTVSCSLLEIYKEQVRVCVCVCEGQGHCCRWSWKLVCLLPSRLPSTLHRSPCYCSSPPLPQITDLLSGGAPGGVVLREDRQEGISCEGLTWHAVGSGEPPRARCCRPCFVCLQMLHLLRLQAGRGPPSPHLLPSPHTPHTTCPSQPPTCCACW